MDLPLTDEQQLLHDTAARCAGRILASPIRTASLTVPRSTRSGAGSWNSVCRRCVRLPYADLRQAAWKPPSSSSSSQRPSAQFPVVGQAVLAAELLQAAGADKELELVAEGNLRVAPVLHPDLTGFGLADQPGVAFDGAGATHVLLVAQADGQRQAAVRATARRRCGYSRPHPRISLHPC